MKEKFIFGYIDCPSCKTQKGMRIAEDKNGDPFGYCEARCSQQLKIGGNKYRVRDFFDAHPEMKRRQNDAPEEQAETMQQAPQIETQEPATAKAKTAKPPRSAFSDALSILGVSQ